MERSIEEVAMALYLKSKDRVLKWQKENAEICSSKSKKCREKMRVERPEDYQRSLQKAKEYYQKKKSQKKNENTETESDLSKV